MLPKYYFGILVILHAHSAELNRGFKNCKEQARSVFGYYLASHLISTVRSSSLSQCVMLCSHQLRCKSLNFQLSTKSCDLNDADRHTHPEDYEQREASVYMDTSEKHRKVSLSCKTFSLVTTIYREKGDKKGKYYPSQSWVCNSYHLKRFLNTLTYSAPNIQ